MKGNDRNEKNYVQLRINHPLLRVNPIKEINQSRGVPEIL